MNDNDLEGIVGYTKDKIIGDFMADLETADPQIVA